MVSCLILTNHLSSISIVFFSSTETEGIETAKRDKNTEQSASFEFTDSNMPEIQDMLKYFRNELEITDEDDILYHSLVALLQDMDQSDTKPIHEYILNGEYHSKE